MDIKVHVREAPGDCYVVELSGEIDVYTSPKVKDAIGELIDRGVPQFRIRRMRHASPCGYLDA